MTYLLGYTEALSWLAIPLSFAAWCVLARGGWQRRASSAPARVPGRRSVRGYHI
jgi:hypothetical protein